MSGRPLDVLEAAVDANVSVRLKSGETYRGTLAGYDQHMNLVLEDLESTPAADAVPVATGSGDESASGGDDGSDADDEDTTIIRGDNVVSITL